MISSMEKIVFKKTSRFYCVPWKDRHLSLANGQYLISSTHDDQTFFLSDSRLYKSNKSEIASSSDFSALYYISGCYLNYDGVQIFGSCEQDAILVNKHHEVSHIKKFVMFDLPSDGYPYRLNDRKISFQDIVISLESQQTEILSVNLDPTHYFSKGAMPYFIRKAHQIENEDLHLLHIMDKYPVIHKILWPVVAVLGVIVLVVLAWVTVKCLPRLMSFYLRLRYGPSQTKSDTKRKLNGFSDSDNSESELKYRKRKKKVYVKNKSTYVQVSNKSRAPNAPEAPPKYQ